MKRFIIFLFAVCFFMSSHAQQVWTEGTFWEIEYSEESGMPDIRYELEASVTINDTLYYPLRSTTETSSGIDAYIRSERGDSLVFVRTPRYGDCLLYDFTTRFEDGCTILFGELGYIGYFWVNETDSTHLEYYYDVIEEGDTLPCWNGLIYKLGHIEGPLALFYMSSDSAEEGDSGMPAEDEGSNHPKSTNVSHILFGTKGGKYSSLNPSSVMEVIAVAPDTDAEYLLSGIVADGRSNTIIIYRGRKYIILR